MFPGGRGGEMETNDEQRVRIYERFVRYEIRILLKPHAWGTYKFIPATSFFLCDFHDMVEELPGITKFTKSVAELHLKSIPFGNGNVDSK